MVLIACSSGDMGTSDDEGEIENEGNNPDDIWLIPFNDLRDGGPGKDGIPSIDNPIFADASSVFLSDDELIVGIKQGDVVKAYPHYILDWHEIVNDDVNGINTTLNYCPLTGTAFAWKSTTGSTFTTFGVSGLLYNSNMILYDRETDSNWSQIQQRCVNGELIGSIPETVMVIETDWKTWKASFPNSQVLTTQTGFVKPYGTLIEWNIKSTTKARQGLYEYDAVSRLRDSQLGDERVNDVRNYIRKGKLWQAFEADENLHARCARSNH